MSRMRCAIEAADRAHDDTGALGAGLDSDVRRSVAQIGDEVHALPQRRAVYRIEFWKIDLGAFTGRGQGGPCLTDAAQ